MGHRQDRGRNLCCSLIAALALLCIVAAAVWFALEARRPPEEPAG